MIGIIVTGHGNFASGVSSSVKLIAGLPEKYEQVDFLEEHGIEELSKNIEAAINKLNDCEGIIIFTDLVGGSPFKASVELSMKYKNIAVLGGTNLGMLIETSMARNFIEDLDTLCNSAISTGKDQLIRYEFVERVEVESEDGI